MGAIQKIRAHLPYEINRFYVQTFYPHEIALYQRMRATPPADPDKTSLAPFVATRSIFVHVPKCAGISIARELYGCRAGGHMGVHDYKNAFSRAEFRDFFKFTFVRNPWDRLVSAYHFLRDGGMNAHDAASAEVSVNRYASFEEFVLNYMADEDFEQILHLVPQYRFLCADETSPAEVDFIGKFETISADFAHICQKLGHKATLTHRNSGQSRPGDYRALYSDRSAEVVARAYARDIALFGYDF